MATLSGKTAIVTGASSGIGAETAHALAAEGATVLLAARREARLESIASDLRDRYDVEAAAVPTDLTDEAAAAALIGTAIDEYGGLDVLVNNAGVSRGSDIAELTTEEYRTMMSVNADGCFFTTRAAIDALAESDGNLIFVGSFAGKFPRSFNPVYAASKWWVRGFAHSVAAQYGDEGVGVTIVNPSEVRTEFETADGTTFEEHFEPGEVTEPEEIAAAIAFAASRDRSTVAELDLYRRDKFADTM